MDRAEIAKRALGLIDLTNLNENCTPDDVQALCQRAQHAHGSTAAVCVYGQFVPLAKRLLDGSNVTVATVVNFPHGGDDVKAVMRETKAVVGDGANDVDLVLPYAAFKSGDKELAAHMISTIRAVTHNQALLKVIIESGELGDAKLIHEASMLALEEGADFIKTSTGKVAENATLDTAQIMLKALREFGDPARGFKPAGGIKTVEDCGAYLALADDIMGPSWVSKSTFRFGASGVLDDVLAALDGGTAAQSDGY